MAFPGCLRSQGRCTGRVISPIGLFRCLQARRPVLSRSARNKECGHTEQVFAMLLLREGEVLGEGGCVNTRGRTDWRPLQEDVILEMRRTFQVSKLNSLRGHCCGSNADGFVTRQRGVQSPQAWRLSFALTLWGFGLFWHQTNGRALQPVKPTSQVAWKSVDGC